MLRPGKHITRTSLIASGFVVATLLTTVTIAWASPKMGAHHGMTMGIHCDGSKGKGMMDHGKHRMRPHNAAIHFLKMDPMLHLSTEQTQQLIRMRDEYIQNNATAEDQLMAAYDDIGHMLHSDEIDMNATNALFEKTGKLEGQLWHAFTQQLHDIKAILTPEQKASLKAMHEKRGRPMGRMQGNIPKPHGNMPM